MTINKTTYHKGAFTNNCSIIFENISSEQTRESVVVRLTYVHQMSGQDNETNSHQDVGDGDDIGEFIYKFNIEENNVEPNQSSMLFEKVVKPTNGKQK